MPSDNIDEAAACRHLLRRIRVVRHFQRRPVEEEHLEELLEVARWTGSAKNLQPWRFVLVTDPIMREQLAECGVRSFAAPLRDAPLALVLVQQPGGYQFDIGRIAQTIIVAATTFGLGACPVSLYNEERARSLLNVPADHGCRFSIALGYPDIPAEKQLRRRLPQLLSRSGRLPLSDLIYHEHFDPTTQ